MIMVINYDIEDDTEITMMVGHHDNEDVQVKMMMR